MFIFENDVWYQFDLVYRIYTNADNETKAVLDVYVDGILVGSGGSEDNVSSHVTGGIVGIELKTKSVRNFKEFNIYFDDTSLSQYNTVVETETTDPTT